jgi:GNAT superfamily N-acetyltransferase
MITKKRQGSFLEFFYFGGACSTQQVGTLNGFFVSPTEFHVGNVYTKSAWRNQGIATALLKRLLFELKRNKVTNVTLDDCSDTGRCYTKLGFSYLEQGYPEMELLL